MGVSGGAGRRAGAIRRHSADKYGTPQNRAVHAWKQWLMNKQQGPRILLINKMIPLGAERDRRGQAEKSLLYANNMQQYMIIAPMAQLDWTHIQTAISPVKSFLNSFSLQKKQPIATNWGLISLPDCCTHFKEADQRRGEATMWMLKRLSESQWWWLPSIAFCGFNPQCTPHASKPKCSNMLTRKKAAFQSNTGNIFLYKRTFKKKKKNGTVNTLLRSGCAKDSVNN